MKRKIIVDVAKEKAATTRAIAVTATSATSTSATSTSSTPAASTAVTGAVNESSFLSRRVPRSLLFYFTDRGRERVKRA